MAGRRVPLVVGLGLVEVRVAVETDCEQLARLLGLPDMLAGAVLRPFSPGVGHPRADTAGNEVR